MYLTRASFLSIVLLLTQSVTANSGSHLFICTSGSFVERETDLQVRAPMAVSITFDWADSTSELLVGSRSSPAIGQRDAIHLDDLLREDHATVTGFMKKDTDTSVYWTLYADESRALLSLDDIVVLAEDCKEIIPGRTNPSAPGSASDPRADNPIAGAAAARHFEALMSAQDRLLALPGELPKYAVVSASGLLYSKISEWAPEAISNGRIDQQQLFYLMAIATTQLASLAAEAGLQEASSCHLREVQALMAAADGAPPQRTRCRRSVYRELTASALRNSGQLRQPRVEEVVNLWATNAVLLGLDSIELDLR